MLSKKMNEAIGKQINAEMYSGYLYLSMASYFAAKNLQGFESWMKVQAQEELSHAMKFFNHVYERGGSVKLLPIEQPPTEWASPLAAFENTYSHEQHVTSLINGLVSLAIEEKDFASQNFLQWYVAEQVEEESTADKTVQQLRLVDGNPQGLFMLDRELAARAFMYPGPALAPAGATGGGA
jgi:ferritin